MVKKEKMIIGISIFYSLILCISLISFFSLFKSKEVLPNNASQPISIIIPFRNESKRILPLINSINNSILPETIEFIFVNDNSSDNSILIINENLNVKYSLLNLTKKKGKKNALELGISSAKYDQIISLDADVYFAENYFQLISKLPISDLTILPVNMTGDSALQKLSKIEFKWLQHITFSSANINYATLCNGANLKFSKQSFENAAKIRNDQKIASGDDIFLLQAIQKLGGKILAFPNFELAVHTQAPNKIKTLLNQRLRWVTKVNNFSGYLGIFIVLLINYLFVYSLVNYGYSKLWIVPILLKIIGEWIGTNEPKLRSIPIILFHQFYYPIYGLLLLFYSPFRKQW